MIVRWTCWLFCILIIGGCGQTARPPKLSVEELEAYKLLLQPIVTGLQRWYATHQTLPEDLTALVPAYLDAEALALPPPAHDLVYVRRMEGVYINYFLEFTLENSYRCRYEIAFQPSPSADWSCLYLPGMAP